MIKQRLVLISLLLSVFSFEIGAAEISVDQACEKISNKLASVKYQECASFGMDKSGHSSTNGFPILIQEFPPLTNRKPKARILLIGGTHGDELSSISIV